MPKEDVEKTASARKFILFGVASVALACVLFGYSKLNKGQSTLLGVRQFNYEIAANEIARQKGLSGRPFIKNNQAMLFVFQESDIYCFWMKDMHFPIDIIWVDSNKDIVGIAEKLSPSSYPKTFCSPKPVQYVFEVSAGQVSAAGVRPGQRINF
jgi:uncharacterized membrane protein (UPF0127 family)